MIDMGISGNDEATLIKLGTILIISVFLGLFFGILSGSCLSLIHISSLQDSLAGIRVVKSFANEDIERDKFAHSNQMFLQSKEMCIRDRYSKLSRFKRQGNFLQ